MLMPRLTAALLILLSAIGTAAAEQAVGLFPGAANDPRRAARIAFELQAETEIHPSLKPNGWVTKVPLPQAPEITRLPNRDKNGEYAAVSPHYIITCAQRPSDAVLQRVAGVMENSLAVNRAVAETMPILRMRQQPKKHRKMHIRLVPTMESYLQHGGEIGSAGVYQSSRLVYTGNGVSPEDQPCTEETLTRDTVLVAYSALGLRADGSLSNEPVNTQLLTHEGTHQCFVYNNLPIWANEGWAEYISAAPHEGGFVNFEKGFSLISARARRSAILGRLDCPFSLSEFFFMSKERMYALGLHSGSTVDTYTLSAMVTAFFLHMDGERGVAAMRDYLQARAECLPHAKATEILAAPYGGVSALQEVIVNAWQARKINLKLKQQK
ncbi:MAG: hypothetical protein IJB00_01860 [Akkermansia sp.]|nr:hypothetical protein [Akkermansia sp.]